MMLAPSSSPDLGALAQRFRAFGEGERRSSSSLYEHLARGIAADADLLRLAAMCPADQPRPNLLLAAVHFLLIQNSGDPLASYYPDLSRTPIGPGAAYPAFRALCFSHRQQIIEIITRRRVQTNEVRRCSYLYPAFCLIARRARSRPLALVEIGASAGLNLLWDRYAYHYHARGTTIHAGDGQSPVQIDCELRGPHIPPLPPEPAEVAYRVGIDRDILDVQDPVHAQWLRVLIWPEHRERAQLLAHAIPLARQAELRLYNGDGASLLPELLLTVPKGAALVAFHTHTLNQFSPAARRKLAAAIVGEARKRTVYRLGNNFEPSPPDRTPLKLHEYGDGERKEYSLAYVAAHGDWIEWGGTSEPTPGSSRGAGRSPSAVRGTPLDAGSACARRR